MTNGQLLDKKILIEQIRHVIIDKESAFFTILTDKKRSIMLRFSAGQLIHTHCRSRNVSDAIAAIVESEQLKFTQASAQAKEAPEVMAATDFLQAINPVEQSLVIEVPVPISSDGAGGLSEQSQLSAGAGASVPHAIAPELQNTLSDIARDYIGMVADILVADVVAKRLSLEDTIDEIARSIPVSDHAAAFRTQVEALDLFPASPDKKPVDDQRPLGFL